MSERRYDLIEWHDGSVRGSVAINDEDGWRGEEVSFASVDEALSITGGTHITRQAASRRRGLGCAELEPEDINVIVRLNGWPVGPDGSEVNLTLDGDHKARGVGRAVAWAAKRAHRVRS